MRAPKPDHSSLRALSAAALASLLITNPLTAPPASTAGTSLYIPSMQEYDEAIKISAAQLQTCIAFDSYDDKRTAFEFQVNPAGVKRDRFWFDDNEHDENWDAVW